MKKRSERCGINNRIEIIRDKTLRSMLTMGPEEEEEEEEEVVVTKRETSSVYDKRLSSVLY